ncbi:hypothetical protein [Zooshikella ganghwensis]|uniref:hypothetical protein n=1 Tax=Zooshikella ganghwensis TaxID=202772 RepID=UPI00042800B5|nr:hypothetical protein [Zooshikella ganghwensis]
MTGDNYLYENPECKIFLEKTCSDSCGSESQFISLGLKDIFESFGELLSPLVIDMEVCFIDKKYFFTRDEFNPKYPHFRFCPKDIDSKVKLMETWTDSELIVVDSINADVLINKIDYILNKNGVIDKDYIPSVRQVIFKASDVKVPIEIDDLENGGIQVIDDLEYKVCYPAKIVDGDVWAIGPNSLSRMAPIYLELSHESGYFELDIQLPLAIGDSRGESLIHDSLKRLFDRGWEELKPPEPLTLS